MVGEHTSYKLPSTLNCNHKVNLIYGLNGVGKSTLSDFLFEYPNCSEKFSSCKINKLDKDTQILVYNQKFIQKNFYESEKQAGFFRFPVKIKRQ